MASSILMEGIPFDAKKEGEEWDRTYFADDFARYFASLFSNGILVKTAKGETLTNQLKASNLNDSVRMSPGGVILEGKFGWIDEEQALDIDVNVSTQIRSDNIVVEKSDLVADRKFEIKIVKGTPGAGFPQLVRTDLIYQACLAQITLAPNSGAIQTLVDKRQDAAMCGVAELVIGPKSISGVDEVRLVASEPTDASSQAEPRVLFMWGEQ